MKKSLYILEPLIVYIISHGSFQFLLYYGVINRIKRQEAFADFLLRHNVSYLTAGVQILSMLFGFLVLMLIDKYTVKKPAQTADMKKYCIHTVVVVLQTLLFAFSLNVIMLNSVFSKWMGNFAKVSKDQSEVPVVMGIFLFGIVSPLVEEYVFRGMLYDRLKESFSVPLSIIVSALFFGIYHGNIVQGVYGFLMGLFLAYVYETYLRLELPLPLFTVMLCHAWGNLLIYLSGRYGLITSVPVYAGVFLLLPALALLTVHK